MGQSTLFNSRSTSINTEPLLNDDSQTVVSREPETNEEKIKIHVQEESGMDHTKVFVLYLEQQ